MRPIPIKKKQVRSIFSLGVLGFFLVIAIGSIEEDFILDLTDTEVEPECKYDLQTDKFETSYKWGNRFEMLLGSWDKYRRIEGKFFRRAKEENKEEGDIIEIVERGVMFKGLRYGPCRTFFYSNDFSKKWERTDYYIAGHKVDKIDYDYWMTGGELPWIDLEKSTDASSVSAWERLGERYPWFIYGVLPYGFDSLYQESYLDTLELIVRNNTFEEDEFDDYYELAIENLKDTPYDSIIQVNSVLSYILGLDLIKENELRMAVLDRYYTGAESTFDVVEDSYPSYLEFVKTEGEVPVADYAFFCEKLDSALNSYGILDLGDPFFVDSVDARIYQALFAIMDSGEEADFKSASALYQANTRRASFMKGLHSFMTEKMDKADTFTPPEVAEMILYTIIMAYFEGDLMKESVKASWLARQGIASLPEVLTSFHSHQSATSVELVGFVYSDGDAEVSDRGFVWASHYNPTLADEHGSTGSGTGYFKVDVLGLSEGETYFARSYATNAAGTSYGNCIEFTAEESSTTETPDLRLASLSIYPNPARSFVILSCSPAVPENCRVQLSDLQGRLCLDEIASSTGIGSEEIRLDISGIAKGSYICRLRLESGETHSSGMLIVTE